MVHTVEEKGWKESDDARFIYAFVIRQGQKTDYLLYMTGVISDTLGTDRYFLTARFPDERKMIRAFSRNIDNLNWVEGPSLYKQYPRIPRGDFAAAHQKRLMKEEEMRREESIRASRSRQSLIESRYRAFYAGII